MFIDYTLSGDKISGEEFRSVLDVLKGSLELDEDSTIGELRMRVMEAEIAYWMHDANRNFDAMRHLTDVIAESEGLKLGSDGWVDRVVKLEELALSVADSENCSEEMTEAA